MLAGVGVPYSTRLERGDVSGVSESVLNAIASALHLDDAERVHLSDRLDILGGNRLGCNVRFDINGIKHFHHPVVGAQRRLRAPRGRGRRRPDEAVDTNPKSGAQTR